MASKRTAGVLPRRWRTALAPSRPARPGLRGPDRRCGLGGLALCRLGAERLQHGVGLVEQEDKGSRVGAADLGCGGARAAPLPPSEDAPAGRRVGGLDARSGCSVPAGRTGRSTKMNCGQPARLPAGSCAGWRESQSILTSTPRARRTAIAASTSTSLGHQSRSSSMYRLPTRLREVRQGR